MCTSLGGQAIRRATSPASDIERATKLIASRGSGGSNYVAREVHRTNLSASTVFECLASGQALIASTALDPGLAKDQYLKFIRSSALTPTTSPAQPNPAPNISRGNSPDPLGGRGGIEGWKAELSA